MIIKSALALLVTASFAGGAVYYGSTPVDESSIESMPAAAQTPPEKLDEEKYIDRFVKPDAESAPDEEQDENGRSDLDKLLDMEADVPDAPETAPETTSDVEMDVEVIVSSPAADGQQDLPRTETVTVTKIVATTATETSSNDEIIEMVLAQTEMIGTQELKDQAYLDIVDYAARHRDYDTALTVLGNIKQTELRDTARARTAIAIAKDGDAARAFGIIDTVEIDQLRDVMRLQVIEALIVPARPPQ